MIPFHIVLYEPEIPPNTGNIIRLAANTGCHLHLIEPLGFDLQEKSLRRAGLDYDEWASVITYPGWNDYIEQWASKTRIFAFSTKGTHNYSQVNYQPGDTLLFGPETRGLPLSLLQSLPASQVVRIPMKPTSRSLNLSNTVAIATYEALRQQAFFDNI
ncbi:MAG: tRNA (cytidine(34)-2'-O)-methyltransferase [Gammaproteobacteria bacterium]